MSFDATIGSGQNSYSSLADANTYHSERLHNSEWAACDNESRESALIWASRSLDDWFQWKGEPTDTDNGLRFPRTNIVDRDGTLLDSSLIPAFLVRATAQLALELIRKDIYQNPDSFGIRKVSAGQNAAAVSFTSEQPTTVSREVTRMVSFYSSSGGNAAFTYLLKA